MRKFKCSQCLKYINKEEGLMIWPKYDKEGLPIDTRIIHKKCNTKTWDYSCELDDVAYKSKKSNKYMNKKDKYKIQDIIEKSFLAGFKNGTKTIMKMYGNLVKAEEDAENSLKN